MFKTTSAYINALKEKKILSKLKLYDTSSNNPIELDSSYESVQKLEELSGDNRCNNLRIYTTNMANLIKNKAIVIAPFILGGLTIASLLNGKYIKTINVGNVYQDKIVEFDENSVLSEEEKTYAETFFYKDYVDENIISICDIENFDKSSYATIYYGEGSDALQVKFLINSDNTWEYSSHTNNLYQKPVDDKTESIGEIDEEYKKLIDDATETFIKQAELSEEEVALLRELISNNENDIIVKIKRCVNLGSKDFDIHSNHFFRTLLAIIAEIILVSYIIRNFSEILYVYEVESKYNYIKNNYKEINIFKAAKKYREEYLKAEENRLMEIIDLLKSHSGDEKIISYYEKRINQNQKRKTLKY